MNLCKSKMKSGIQSTLKEKMYKESWSSVAFVSKINIRRKLKPKHSRFGTFIDFKNDFPPDSNEETGREGVPMFPVVNEVGQLNENFLNSLQTFFLNDGLLPRKYVYKILSIIEDYFRSSKTSTVIDIGLKNSAVINVCGDIHGQYYDLIKIFKLRGKYRLNINLFCG